MSLNIWSIFFACSVLVIGQAIASDSDLLVELDHGGSLMGTSLKSFSGRQIRSFLGVPYAKPPVGELRFKVGI